MRQHWKALVAVAAVVIIIALAVVFISTRPDPAADPTTETTIETGTLGFPVSELSIGEGGSGAAPDGTTPIGYNGSCDSAAQAAANYAPLFNNFNVETWADQKTVLTSVAVPGEWLTEATEVSDLIAETATTNDLPGLFDGGWMKQINVQAGGLYRLVSCEATDTALVQVFYGGLNADETVPAGFFGTISMELAWTDDDWKISDALIRIDDTEFQQRLIDQGPSGGVPGDPTGELPVLTNDLATYYFDEDMSREGWIEYANAIR